MVLISGSQGFIGHNLMQALPSAIGLDNVDRGKKQTFLKVDLKDYNETFWSLKDLNIKVIVHLAAIPSVPASYVDPMKTYSNNVSASLNLIKVAKILGVEKFIFASSSSVLGPSPYGHSKKIIEEVLEHTMASYSTLRFFNVFGMGQRENVIDIMYKCIKKDLPFIMNGDGNTTRDFTYIDNVVTGIIKAIDHKYDGQILELGTGTPHSLNEIFEMIKNYVNPNYSKLMYGPERAGDIKYSQANTFLDRNEITSFNEGLQKWLQLMESQN